MKNYEVEWRESDEYMMKYDDLVIKIAKLKGTLGEFDDYAYYEQRTKDIEQATNIVEENQSAEKIRRLEDEEYQLEQEALEAEEGSPSEVTLLNKELHAIKEKELNELLAKRNILVEALERIRDSEDVKELLEGQSIDILFSQYDSDVEQFGKNNAIYMLLYGLIDQKAEKR